MMWVTYAKGRLPLQHGAQQKCQGQIAMGMCPLLPYGAIHAAKMLSSLTIALSQLSLVLVLVIGVLVQERPPSSLNLAIGPG